MENRLPHWLNFEMQTDGGYVISEVVLRRVSWDEMVKLMEPKHYGIPAYIAFDKEGRVCVYPFAERP